MKNKLKNKTFQSTRGFNDQFITYITTYDVTLKGWAGGCKSIKNRPTYISKMEG